MIDRLGLAALAAYALTVAAANLAIVYVGLAPVGFGLEAPAGVYFAGLALALRDVLHERLGRRAVLVAIALGALASAILSPELALASAAAFGLAELADMAIYSRLRRRSWLWAMVASNTVGLLVDSLLFLSLAFGSLAFLPGQLVGKLWATLGAAALLHMARRHIVAEEVQA